MYIYTGGSGYLHPFWGLDNYPPLNRYRTEGIKNAQIKKKVRKNGKKNGNTRGRCDFEKAQNRKKNETPKARRDFDTTKYKID